jgi:hypothetical protein
MTESDRGQLPDFRQARHPTRVYRGRCDGDGRVVTVSDSSLDDADDNCRTLNPETSRAVRDCSPWFGWGAVDDASRQLGLALLLDVSGDSETALFWLESFTETYVRRLPSSWCVPEIDIALWLYCFSNARPDS